jgi:hypothetical protein
LATAPLQAAPATSADKASSAPAEKVRKELDRLISIEIDQQPLALAINQLHEQTRINFVLDRLAIAQIGVDVDQVTVSVRLKEVKVRSALRTILAPFNLTFVVLGDTVLISNEDVASLRQLRQRVNVDLEKVELNKALKGLARETATNLVMDPRVGKEAQAPVTLQMEDVALETAVRLLAEMAGLKAVRVGNALFITTKPIAAEMRADPDLAPSTPMGVPVPDKMIFVGPGGAPAAGPAPAIVAPAKPADDPTDKAPMKKARTDDDPPPKEEKPPEKR